MPGSYDPGRNNSGPAVRLIPRLEDGERGAMMAGVIEELPASGPREYLRLLRKYSLLGLILALLGAGGGVAFVVLSSPLYKVETMLEVQGINEAWLKGSFELPSSYDSNIVNVQTQIKLLKEGPFLRRVYDRLQAETVPPPPDPPGFFSRLRRRVYKDTQDPIEVMKEGLQRAFLSFDARQVTGTRLILMTCDSTNPQMASQFINTMASEFTEETIRARSQTSQKTSEWLTAQIEETKIKLQEAEERLQDFIKRSGNLFASQDSTLDDSKLKQLQTELAAIQAERIAKQARYEMVSKSSPETLPEALDDEVLRGFQRQISELRREKASLETTLTPNHSKVQKVDAQLGAVEASLQIEINSVVARLRNEYESALRRESLLASAYTAQGQRVSSVAGKSAEHNALGREVETLRQMYQGLLVQANQTGLSGSVPVNPIRLIEATSPPVEPYSPRPLLNISLGTIGGLLLTGCIGFLREKFDRSVRSSRVTQRMFNVPQLGVIPSAKLFSQPGLLARLRRFGPERHLNGGIQSGERPALQELAAWDEGPSFMAESFRATLASLMREPAGGGPPKVILVTSPGPEEGKTTITSNLGIALAETGQKVLLVDADFRRPRLHRLFGLDNSRSLVDILTEQIPISDGDVGEIAVATAVPGLSVLVNRPTQHNVSKVLYSPRLRSLLESLREQFDFILLDSAPFLHLADARLIAPWTDGVILVLRAGATDRDSALEACQCIQADGLALLGTVLNDWNPGKSHVKHHYYYDYADGDK